MKKIIGFMLALCFVFGVSFSVKAAPRHSIDFSGKKIMTLAVIPYINVSGENTPYVMDSLKESYTDYFVKEGFKVASKEKVDAALSEAGYFENDNVIASKEVLKSVATSLNADFVIAMEVEEISTSREDEFPKTKLTAKVKLLYEVYKNSIDKTYQFRIATAKDNKATLAEVGPKYAVKTALDQALERGNHRIVEITDGANIPQN